MTTITPPANAVNGHPGEPDPAPRWGVIVLAVAASVPVWMLSDPATTVQYLATVLTGVVCTGPGNRR